MTLDTDFHSHVAKSSAAQMARSAQNKGLRVLGLSEHIFQMVEARPLLEHMPLEGPLRPFASYVEAVHKASQDGQIDVRLGLEVDFIPEHMAAIYAALQEYPWDFLIGSVHEIAGSLFENGQVQSREQGEALWQEYFQLLRAAVNSGLFNVVSHPVRMRATNAYLPATFNSELEHLAAEAARRDVALEINGYDTLSYPDVVRRLAQACAQQGTAISVGSDAHYPHQLAQAHTQTAALLRGVGINKVRIWKQRVAEDYEF